MKIIPKVDQGEKINYKGDLTIESDVGEDAEIVVEDGTIKINGNVHSNAKITLKISEEKRASMNVATNQAFSMAGLGNFISIGSCSKVTIGKRIICDGSMSSRGNSAVYLPSRGREIVTLTINDKKYQGKKIETVGDNVFVDGVPAVAPAHGPLVIESGPMPKISIVGAVMNRVFINSDGDVEVQGNIGQDCLMQCLNGEFTAKHIGSNTVIKTRNAINVGEVGNFCQFSSTHYGLNADSLGDNVKVDVRDAIVINGDVGNYTQLQSQQYGLQARNLGQSVNVTVRDAIKVRNIGANSIINSAQYGLHAQDIQENVYVTVRDAVSVNSVGNDSHITSAQYGIEVSERVGNDVELTGRDQLTVGSVGDNSKLTSNTSTIKVIDQCGKHVVIKGRDSVKVKDVGDNSSITSTNDEVNARNLGQNVSISARDDVVVNGICPDNARLTSAHGKVRKTSQAALKGNSIFSGKPESTKAKQETHWSDLRYN